MISCLIVEDSPINWMVIQNQLARMGVTAEVFHEGNSALERCLKKGMPHLIILDGYMPGMDGVTFISELRKTEKGKTPFILFCSSSLDRHDIERALKKGADCHFPKPLSPDQLRYAMTEAEKRFEQLGRTADDR